MAVLISPNWPDSRAVQIRRRPCDTARAYRVSNAAAGPCGVCIARPKTAG
jgi:hypothetical protein